MLILSVILGILLMFGGFRCLFHPAAAFLETGYFIAILLFVYGIIGIANVIRKRAQAIELIVHIPAIIIGIIAFFRPGTTLAFDAVILYLVAAWFMAQGAVSIYVSIKAKPYKKGWYWGLILGILGLILGIYSFAHPMVSVFAIGMLIGIYLIETGLNMIVLATAIDSIKNE